MKKALTLLLLITVIVIAKDTTDIHIKDTLVTKTVESNTGFFSIAFWQTAMSVLAGSALTLLGVYFSNRHQRKLANEQIKHQLLVAQVDLDVATKRKMIGDLIEQSKVVSKCVFSLFHLTNDLVGTISTFQKFTREEIPKQADEVVVSELINRNRNLLDKILNLNDAISNENKELYYISGMMVFYLGQDDEDLEELKMLTTQLQNSYSAYAEFIINGLKSKMVIKTKDKMRDSLGNKLEECHGLFLKKVHNIIDRERDIMDNILLKKSINELPINPKFQHTLD